VTIFGIDISHYQKDIDLGVAVHDHNLTFLAAKLTEGQGLKDAVHGHFKAEAERLGLLFTSYHWVRGDSSPAAQVQNVLEALKGDKSVPIMLDVERTQGGNPAWSDVAGVRAGLVAHGLKVGLIYLPQWYWESTLHRPKIPDNWALFQSDYGSNSGAYPGDNSDRWLHGSRKADLLQFTSQGQHLFGYHGNGLDVDAYRGTRDDLAKTGWFKDYRKKVAPVPPEKNKPAPKPPKGPVLKTNVSLYKRAIAKAAVDYPIPTSRPKNHKIQAEIEALRKTLSES
jgi:hypothetical protein